MHGSRFLPDLGFMRIPIKRRQRGSWGWKIWCWIMLDINFGFVTYGKKKRQGKSMQFFNVWYFGELPQSAETQNYTGCHRDPRCISIAGFMEDTIPGRSFQDEHFSDIRTGFQSMAKTADWVSMIWRFPKMGLPWNHPGYFRIFHYEPAIGDPPCLYMKFHGLPVADARRFWLNLGIDTVVKWYTEPWTDGGVNMGFSKSIAYPKNLGLNKSQLHTITMIL